jgi:hypothetical protein
MGVLGDIGGFISDTWDNMTGSGESVAVNTEDRTAATRDAGQQQMFNDFLKYLFGGNEYRRYSIDEFIEKNSDVAKELGIDPKNITPNDRVRAEEYMRSVQAQSGMSGPASAMLGERVTIDPYRDRIAQDIGYTQQNDQALLDALSGITGDRNAANEQYGGTIQGLMDSWGGLANSAPINLTGAGLSGPVQFATGSQRNAANNMTGWAGTLNDIANATANNNTVLAQIENQVANAYTPNRAQNEYLNYIGGLNAQNDQLRYGTPTTTSTGVYDPATNTLAGAGQLASLFTGISNGGGISNILSGLI